MRMFILMICAAAVIAFAGSSDAQSEGLDGERLFVAKGCIGCHGASGRGGVGPSLARTELTFRMFIQQVRRPRGIMHAFTADDVSEDQALEILNYLRGVEAAPERLRAELPQGVQDSTSCEGCHSRYHSTIVSQFLGSAMGLPGTQNARVDYPLRKIGCVDCHGNDHTAIMRSKGRVEELVCARCHPVIYKDHVLDAGHSYGPGPGDLGINWERNIGVPHYAQMPRKVMEMGCDPCHAQAGATDAVYWSDSLMQYVDTSSLTYRNGCIACHTRHAFDLGEARKPESCYTCHMGPDHPNYEAYMSSKHGSIYAARGDAWDWRTPLPQAEYDTPTCAYCHMVYVDDDGARRSSHHMTTKIIWGMGVQPAVGRIDDITATPDNRSRRNEMVKLCMTCHSEDKARGYLESADAHKLAGDALVIEAREILRELYDDGLIDPGHQQLSAGLLRGPRFTAVALGEEQMAQHSPTSLYYDVAPIEREYFDMFFFSALKSYKGAFHMSPDYAWWYGYAAVLGDLAAIRHEAERLRSEHATRSRTLFMIVTGPIMVLVVIGVLHGVRGYTRRRGRA